MKINPPHIIFISIYRIIWLSFYFVSDVNRVKFKDFVNELAHTKTDGDEKILILKSKYLRAIETPHSSSLQGEYSYSPQYDPRNSIGIPVSPLSDYSSVSSIHSSPRPKQPPPYRPPPPPVYSSTSSLDTISISSFGSYIETPSAPPRRRESTRKKSIPEISTPPKSSMTDIPSIGLRPPSEDEVTPVKSNARRNQREDFSTLMGGTSTPIHRDLDEHSPETPINNVDQKGEKKTISVKERTKEFNRLASVEDELSPRAPKSAEKDRSKSKLVSTIF